MESKDRLFHFSCFLGRREFCSSNLAINCWTRLTILLESASCWICCARSRQSSTPVLGGELSFPPGSKIDSCTPLDLSDLSVSLRCSITSSLSIESLFVFLFGLIFELPSCIATFAAPANSVRPKGWLSGFDRRSPAFVGVRPRSFSRQRRGFARKALSFFSFDYSFEFPNSSRRRVIRVRSFGNS